MVDAFVDEIKQLNTFLSHNKDVLGSKADTTLHGQATLLCKRIVSNRALFNSDVDAANTISETIQEGPWTTSQKETIAQTICMCMEPELQCSMKTQELQFGFQTYWWKTVLDVVKDEAQTDDDKTAAIAAVCCALGLFKPSEQTYRHILQVCIGLHMFKSFIITKLNRTHPPLSTQCTKLASIHSPAQTITHPSHNWRAMNMPCTVVVYIRLASKIPSAIVASKMPNKFRDH